MQVPRHIGIILDGNRRFAKRLMLKPFMGHEWGAKKFKEFLEWCHELNVYEVTAYTFSEQNFNRPKEEFDYLMKLFRKEYDSLGTDKNVEKLKEKGIRINFIGRIWKFPADVKASMNNLMEKTKKNTKRIVNFAMAYGGREEVLDAVQKIAEDVKSGKLDVKSINEKVFGDHLYMNSEPDLIIRTGGDHRTSNFLIWQSHYSEWFFIDKSWPEMEKTDLLAVIDDYAKRERRFGK